MKLYSKAVKFERVYQFLNGSLFQGLIFIHLLSAKKRKYFLLVDINDAIHIPTTDKISRFQDMNDNLGKCFEFRNGNR